MEITARVSVTTPVWITVLTNVTCVKMNTSEVQQFKVSLLYIGLQLQLGSRTTAITALPNDSLQQKAVPRVRQ